MAVVEIHVGRRSYQLACDDGQEAHLQRLAANINQRIAELSSAADGTSDAMLLVMAALTMQDELNDALKKGGGNNTLNREAVEAEIDTAVAEAVSTIAEYVENLAQRFEKR